MNVADSEVVASVMQMAGYETVENIDEADAVFLNTCSVRENAENKIYHRLEALHNINKNKGKKVILGVLGCMAERVKDELIENHHANLVAGPDSYMSLPDLIAQCELGQNAIDTNLSLTETYRDVLPKRAHGMKISGFVSIMRGCNNFCHYCIVPYTRGRERSRDIDSILKECVDLRDRGYKELTLLGQNVNSYGRDLYGKPRFADVLEAVADTGIERLRFATSHPKDLTDEVIAKFGTLDALMPALHLPAQSGSDSILKAMHRSYTVEHYLGLIEKLRDVKPGISLSTDIIVGFPGETEQDFMGTYRLVEEVGYSQVFTFIYSKREGTPAASYFDDTPREVIQERFDRLREVVERGAYDFNQAQKGHVVDVLIEGASKKDSRIATGHSPENINVHAPIPEGAVLEDLVGKIVPVKIEEARTWYLRGTMV